LLKNLTKAIEMIMGRKPDIQLPKKSEMPTRSRLMIASIKLWICNKTRTLFAFHKSGKLLTLGLANGEHAVSNFIKTPHVLYLSFSLSPHLHPAAFSLSVHVDFFFCESRLLL
jgi:hypothetical protein